MRNMGTHINFRSFGGDASGGEGSKTTKPTGGCLPLARQSSVYSLTFDEFQSTLGGFGKDFGSMNMDELLKNIWTAEETQAISSPAAVVQPGGAGGGGVPGGDLQRQGSLTLPRTLSQKKVDEVWRDLIAKEINGNSGDSSGAGSNVPQRQQTLGEMTLEEFLVRVGVAREDNDTKQIGQLNETNSGFYANSNAALPLGFNQPIQNSILFSGNNNSMVLNQSPGLGLNVAGTRQQQLQQPQQRPQPPTLFPKQANVAFGATTNLVNDSNAGVADNSVNDNSVLVGLGTRVTVAAVSPGTSGADTHSLSPVPHVFGRGRRSNPALEKVIERRQRRMIKNRESAARSRARKQAYTLELEAEITKLKELNEELQRKQAEMLEMQKNEFKESLTRPWGCKRQCLRRTLTGPW